jgi:predicted  nucleic acid-binding Zn-ribbon protein
MSTEKTRLEAEIEKLRASVSRLENQLSEAKENERLLVEYPDLHYTGNCMSVAGL